MTDQAMRKAILTNLFPVSDQWILNFHSTIMASFTSQMNSITVKKKKKKTTLFKGPFCDLNMIFL